jgi:hypothetical protein
MDESYGSEVIPKLFSLSCLVGNSTAWPFFEWDWIGVIDWKNKQLEAQGRKQLSRYHASDCSSFKGDFDGWSEDERREFIGKLVPLFGKHGFHIYGYDVPLQLLVSEIPETASNPVGFAYVILLQLIMREICKNTLTIYPDAVISLHHDRCRYDAVLQEAFNRMIMDENFECRCRNQFASITSEGWEHCIPLQPADFLAYENYKDGLRRLEPRNRRKSLELLLDLDSISGRSLGFTAESIRILKRNIENMDNETKEILMRNARIKLPQIKRH